MAKHIFILVAVMLVTGSFGGVVNYFQTKTTEPEDANIWRSITIGTAAALLVPLFLNMISSNLIDATRGDPTKLLPFAGFCLIASISSASFIRTLSDKVLSEAKAAKEEAKQAKEEAIQASEDVRDVQTSINPILEKESEPEENKQQPSTTLSGVPVGDEDRILHALGSSNYAYRTANGLARDARFDIEKANSVLQNLENKGLVAQKTGRKGNQLWFLTQRGLEHYDSLRFANVTHG